MISTGSHLLMRNKFWGLMLLAFALASRRGDAVVLDDSLRHEVLTTWTTEQGLPQNFIRAITQTADGFIWIGTMNGLARFDGVRFRGFNRDGPAELQNNIEGLEPDAHGGLWIATVSGVFHYAHQRFDPVSAAGQLHFRPEVMARGHDGEVWLYADRRLLRSHDNGMEVRALPADAHGLRDMAESTDGTLWIADGESMFALRNGAAAQRYLLPGAQMAYADVFGEVFAGDGHRLFRFDGRGFTKVSDPGMDNFVNMMVDHQKRLWMASGGLHGVSRKTGDIKESLTTANGLASDDVRLLFEDRSGDVWLGTISGLQRLHHGVFTTYTAEDGLPREGSQVDAVFQQKNGSIWAGTLEGGVAEFSEGRFKRYGKAQGLPAGQVRGFFDNGKRPAIAISDYGVFVDRGSGFSKLKIIPSGYVNTPTKAVDDSVWFSVHHKGLYRLKDGQLTHFGRLKYLYYET